MTYVLFFLVGLVFGAGAVIWLHLHEDAIACELGGVSVQVFTAERRLGAMFHRLEAQVAAGLRALTARAAQETPQAALVRTAAKPRNDVHLVLMDKNERQVLRVDKVDSRRRAHSLTDGKRQFICARGSNDDSYFIYREVA